MTKVLILLYGGRTDVHAYACIYGLSKLCSSSCWSITMNNVIMILIIWNIWIIIIVIIIVIIIKTKTFKTTVTFKETLQQYKLIQTSVKTGPSYYLTLRVAIFWDIVFPTWIICPLLKHVTHTILERANILHDNLVKFVFMW